MLTPVNQAFNPVRPQFGRGQVTFITNLEEGCLPVDLKKLEENPSTMLPKVQNALADLREFLKENRYRINLKLITPRTLSDVQTVWQNLRQMGLKLPAVKTLFTEAGGQASERVKPENKAAFPFDEAHTKPVHYQKQDEKTRDSKRAKYSQGQDYRVWQAVGSAEIRGDLAVVASDKASDFDMLNPANFVRLSKGLESLNNRQDIARKPWEFKVLMDTSAELRDDMARLPFVGIVLKDGEKPLAEPLQQLVDVYGKGLNRKIIVAKKEDLVEGIKDAICTRLNHQNETFMNSFLYDHGFKSREEQHLARRPRKG